MQVFVDRAAEVLAGREARALRGFRLRWEGCGVEADEEPDETEICVPPVLKIFENGRLTVMVAVTMTELLVPPWKLPRATVGVIVVAPAGKYFLATTTFSPNSRRARLS